MTFEELKAQDSQYILNTYGRNQIDIDHGQGATLYSLDGQKYIDFTSGIGVCSLGYGNDAWVQAVTDQAKKLQHISNLYYTQPAPNWQKSSASAPVWQASFSPTPALRPMRV